MNSVKCEVENKRKNKIEMSQLNKKDKRKICQRYSNNIIATGS